ncbi:MAG: hypothetical protein ACREPM_24765, partial [Gemmatimonadaceae bacterium]
MNERRRPSRRGRGQRPSNRPSDEVTDNPYREDAEGAAPSGKSDDAGERPSGSEGAERSANVETESTPRQERYTAPAEAPPAPPQQESGGGDAGGGGTGGESRNANAARELDTGEDARPESGTDGRTSGPTQASQMPQQQAGQGGGGQYQQRNDRGGDGGFHDRRNGRRHRRGRGRGPRREGGAGGGGGGGGGGVGGGGGQQQQQQQQPQQQVQITATSEARGWFEPARDAGFIRRPTNSYLAEAGDAYVPPHVVRQFALRRADLIDAAIGFDPRGRPTVVEVKSINDDDPAAAGRRPEFNSLPASYPERKLFMETGRPAKAGNELIRRAIDLIAPIGYGQRALIVAPARAGKTTLLHA